MQQKLKEKRDILRDTLKYLENSLGEQMETISLDRVSLGLFFTGVKLSNGYGGISSTPIKNVTEAICCPREAGMMPYAGRFQGMPVKMALEEMLNDNPFHRSLGLAVINALSNTIWLNNNHQEYKIIRNADVVKTIHIPKDANVVVIGSLIPYIKLLKENNNDFYILESDTFNLKDDELPFCLPIEKAPQKVPFADTLIITGTTLIDDTLDEILEMARTDAEIVLVGPTGSILPEALFKRGVNIVSGVIVTKPDELLDMLAKGASGFHFFGKSVEKIIIEKD